MNRRVLCVDDEASVLEGFRRLLRKDVELTTAASGPAALEVLRAGAPFAVVVTDMRMPGMDGLQLLAAVQEGWPLTVRMMLTGNNDLQTAMDAVNQGRVFRFMTKPCSIEVMRANLAAGIEQYRLLTAEKDLLDKTVAGSIHLLTELIDLLDPRLFQRSRRIREVMRYLAKQTASPIGWQTDLAVLLGDIGLLTLPEELRRKRGQGAALDATEQALIDGVPATGARLLRHIPRLEAVADLIVSAPDAARGDIQRIRACAAFVELETAGLAPADCVSRLRAGGQHAADLIDHLAAITPRDAPAAAPQGETRSLTVRQLASGMVLLDHLCLTDGRTLVSSGHRLTAAMLERVRNFHSLAGLREPIAVHIPASEGPRP